MYTNLLLILIIYYNTFLLFANKHLIISPNKLIGSSTFC